MLKKLKEFRIIISVIIFIFLGGVAFAGFFALPKKVKSVEKKVTDNTATMNKLAHTVDKYIGEQRIREKAQERREELMLELLKR